jgi:hypothetical protein
VEMVVVDLAVQMEDWARWSASALMDTGRAI